MIFPNKSGTRHAPYTRCVVFKVILTLDERSCLFVNHHNSAEMWVIIAVPVDSGRLRYEIFMIVIGLDERIGNVSTKARELDTCISLRMNEVGTHFYQLS